MIRFIDPEQEPEAYAQAHAAQIAAQQARIERGRAMWKREHRRDVLAQIAFLAATGVLGAASVWFWLNVTHWLVYVP